MAEEEQELRALCAAGKKIEAIRRYREIHNVGLREAKEAVEAIVASPEAPAAGRLESGDPAAEIDALLQSGQKIQAIKRYRELHNVGLKEAKEAIDARAAATGAPAARSGCFIATAAYGPAAPEVARLRRFRDRVLRRSRGGRVFVRIYYRASPPLAAVLGRSAVGRAVARFLLRPLVAGCRACSRGRCGRGEKEYG